MGPLRYGCRKYCTYLIVKKALDNSVVCTTSKSSQESKSQAARLISTTRLNVLRRFYLWPINLVIFQESLDRSAVSSRFASMPPIQPDLAAGPSRRHCHSTTVAPAATIGISYLGVGFTLRCFQRLSRPDMTTQLCHWRDNWWIRGPFTSVLSY